VYCTRWFWQNTTPPATYYQIRSANLSVIRPLYTADSVGGNPAVTNVRSGTVYGPNSELTGTCAVPAAGSVAFGVPVDATTGTAVLTPESVRSAVGMASANLDTQLAAKPTATQVRTEMDSNSTKLANLDATVSSRLAASSYSAAPSAATNASAVRTELATELGRIDTTVSSRSTYAGADTSGTTTLLSRLTSGRAGNLDNLDAAVSTRLASSGYTAPPSVGDIATAVWAAATRTLTTAIDNSATIAAAVWSYATGRTITGGTVDTLTNAPDVPTEAEIATAVRSELATELAHLDVDVSSRLAPDGTLATVTTLTNAPDVPTPEDIAAEVWSTTTREVTGGTVDNLTNAPDVPTESEIAEAVRTELTPELERVSNAATTQEVADIVEGGLGEN
jgi:hypothetical protein